MRKLAFVALGLTGLLALPVSAAPGTSGPFAGSVRQGETDTHLYNNNPKNFDCIQITTNYQVSLSHVPPGDTLTLTAGGRTATSIGGTAVSFESGVCTHFDITVTGTAVADSATYVVTVTSGPLGALGDWS